MTLLRTLLPLALLATLSSALWAYPEYQRFSQQNSGRPVNCALCHVNPDGPEGTSEGQVGSLNAEEMNRLSLARIALQPGQSVDSPILNDFGDEIVRAIGKTRVLELRARPAELAQLLGTKSDLDGDGIPDSREYLDGTHPLMKAHGDPWLLFLNNLKRNRFHLAMISLATLAGLYGLRNTLRGFAVRSDEPSRSKP